MQPGRFQHPRDYFMLMPPITLQAALDLLEGQAGKEREAMRGVVKSVLDENWSDWAQHKNDYLGILHDVILSKVKAMRADAPSKLKPHAPTREILNMIVGKK